MPQHIQPFLRAREEAMEASGLVKTLDSLAVTELEAAEAQGLTKKVVPVGLTFITNGKSYTAK